MGAAAGIGADQHPPPRDCGELGESSAGRGDVVGGGVRPGVAGAEHDGQRLPGSFRAVISKHSQGVEPVGFLPRRRGLLLIGVHGDDGGVDVDRDQPAAGAGRRISGQFPGAFPGCGPCFADRCHRRGRVRCELRDQTGYDRVGSHRPEQARLGAQHADVSQAVAA